MKKLFFLLVFFLPRLAFGDVAYVTSMTANADFFTDWTLSSYAVTGSDTLMLCSAEVKFTTVSGVTFGVNSFTSVNSMSPSGSGQLSLWRRAGVSGTQDVVFTFAGSAARFVVACATFSGVDQTTPLGTSSTSTDYTSSPVNITVPTNGLGYDVAMDRDANPGCQAQVPGGSQIKRFDDCYNGGASASTQHFASTRATSGTLTWTDPTGGYIGQIGVPINAAAPPAPSGVVSRRIVGIQ